MSEQRDLQMLNERSQGLTFHAIGKLHGVSASRAQQIIKRAALRMGKVYVEPVRSRVDSRPTGFYRMCANSSDRLSVIVDADLALFQRYEKARDEFYEVQDELSALYRNARDERMDLAERLTRETTTERAMALAREAVNTLAGTGNHRAAVALLREELFALGDDALT